MWLAKTGACWQGSKRFDLGRVGCAARSGEGRCPSRSPGYFGTKEERRRTALKGTLRLLMLFTTVGAGVYYGGPFVQGLNTTRAVSAHIGVGGASLDLSIFLDAKGFDKTRLPYHHAEPMINRCRTKSQILLRNFEFCWNVDENRSVSDFHAGALHVTPASTEQRAFERTYCERSQSWEWARDLEQFCSKYVKLTGKQ